MRYGVFGLFALAGVIGLSAACGSSPSPTATGPADPAATAPGGTTPPTGTATTSPATPPPPPASCARADVARSAPVALFDTFQAEMATLAGAARTSRVDRLLADVASQGGTPLADPKTGRVVFLARAGGPWSVVGSFVGWDKTRAVAMKTIDGTDLAFADTTVARGTSEQYKLLTGATDDGFHQDPLAKNLVWDGVQRGTVGEFNAIVHPDETPAKSGRIEYQGKVHAKELANDRDVFVYLPPKYDDGSCAKLPVVIFHDGNESLTRGDFAGAAEALYVAHPELSAVLVFAALPTQDVRTAEYTFGAGTSGDAYVDFVVSDLLPEVAKVYRVCSKPGARGISGASLGGLIAAYAAFQKPGAFGWVGAQSASLFWNGNALIAQAQSSPPIPTRFYLDSGEPNGACGVDDNCAVTDQMNQTLKTKGYDVERVTVMNADHDWPYWHDRIAGMLTHFRSGQTVCD